MQDFLHQQYEWVDFPWDDAMMQPEWNFPFPPGCHTCFLQRYRSHHFAPAKKKRGDPDTTKRYPLEQGEFFPGFFLYETVTS